jgi:hypothetical protein
MLSMWLRAEVEPVEPPAVDEGTYCAYWVTEKTAAEVGVS